MKKTRKILAMAACAVLLVCISVGATVAYLTSQDSVTNTFTVGNIQIKLDEKKVDTNGMPVKPEERTEEGNDYKLMPGHTYTKDPTVTIVKGSEDAYIRILVKVEKINNLKEAFPKEKYSDYYDDDEVFKLEKLCNNMKPNAWVYTNYSESKDENNNTDGVYEFRYSGVVSSLENQDMTLVPLFDSITVPGTLDNTALAKLDGVKIVITAEAMQRDGFTTADAAWKAFSD